MSKEEKTEEDLKHLLLSYNEGLQLWQRQFGSKETVSQIQLSQVEKPVEEIEKICKLIHANTTKMGIVFTRPLKDIAAAYKQTNELSTSTVFLVSLVIQLLQTKESELLRDELVRRIKDLLSSLQFFTKALELTNEDLRLVGVGKVWDSVTQVSKSIKLGKLGLLKLKLSEASMVIGDGLEELEEWIADPLAMDDEDDPFGIESDSEKEESTDEKEDYSDLIPKLEFFAKKIKLVKLIIAWTVKNVPKQIDNGNVDKIHSIIKKLNEYVDELIYSLKFENDLDQASSWFDKLSIESLALMEILKSNNTQNDKNLKWIATWTLKFKE